MIVAGLADIEAARAGSAELVLALAGSEGRLWYNNCSRKELNLTVIVGF